MTFCELIDAVHRDIAEIDPTGCVKVSCGAWYFGHHEVADTREIDFEIWYDRTGEHYKGVTPAEAYEHFVAAIRPQPQPTLTEVLELCDTPANAEQVV